MTKGLGADAQYSVGTRFSKTLRQRGHRGFVVNGYVFDRKGYGKLKRMYEARHKTMESRFGDTEEEQ